MAAALSQPALFALDPQLLLHDKALLWRLAIETGFMAATLAAVLLVRPALRRLTVILARHAGPTLSPLTTPLARVVPWALLLLVLWFGRLAFRNLGWDVRPLRLAESLALAWVIIRLASSLARNRSVAAGIAIAAWAYAALRILGLLEPLASLLDSMSLTVGHLKLSALLVVKGATLLAVLLWLANRVSRILERQFAGVTTIAPAMQVLASKVTRLTLITLAVLVALNAVGIDLTGFAVFSGAVGVGIGFGLQKVVSNLISGFILLMDRSIKPGDVIEIDGTYGWITRLNARFVSVSTRDGIEHLIPNEDLITHRVTNWSYTNDLVRLHVPVPVAYGCDVKLAMRLCVEATRSVPRVLDSPEPVCLLRAFGENGFQLEQRFWIRDPRGGTVNVRSAVMLEMWERFREHGIRIPYPRREIDVLAASGLARDAATASAPPGDASG